MASSSAGGMAWSAVPITAHDGIVFQAGTPDFWVSAMELSGRWVAASILASLAGRPLAMQDGNTVLLDVDVDGARECARVRLGGHVRRRQDARTGVGGDELADGLALRGREGIHVDQRLDLLVAGGGVGDDGATVGVPDQDDGAGDGVQEVADVGGVIPDAEQRVRRHVDRVPVILEVADDGVPAGTVGPGPVDQDDAGLGPPPATVLAEAPASTCAALACAALAIPAVASSPTAATAAVSATMRFFARGTT